MPPVSRHQVSPTAGVQEHDLEAITSGAKIKQRLRGGASEATFNQGRWGGVGPAYLGVFGSADDLENKGFTDNVRRRPREGGHHFGNQPVTRPKGFARMHNPQ